MQNPLNETVFEEYIAEYLANSPLYNKRVSAQFDIDTLCDHDMLEQFLRQQPKVWAKLTTFFPGRETDVVIAEYNSSCFSILITIRRTNYERAEY